MIRSELISAGEVDERTQAVLGVDGNEAGAGDLIMFRRNDNSIDAGGERLSNRHIARFEGRDQHGDTIMTRRTGAGWSPRFTVPAAYLAQYGQLAYGGNAHAVEGRTCDTSHTLQAPGMGAADNYVGPTRGRQENRLYTITDRPNRSELDGGTDIGQAGEDVRAAIMTREPDDLTATEVIRDSQAGAEPDVEDGTVAAVGC